MFADGVRGVGTVDLIFRELGFRLGALPLWEGFVVDAWVVIWLGCRGIGGLLHVVVVHLIIQT